MTNRNRKIDSLPLQECYISCQFLESVICYHVVKKARLNAMAAYADIRARLFDENRG